MSDEPSLIQFTVARLMHATLWFGATAVVVATATPVPIYKGLPPPDAVH